MSQPAIVPPPGFDDLATDDKIDYVSALWERILAAGAPDSPQWHRDLVRAELDAHDADPGTTEDWATVRANVEQRLRDRTR